MALKAQDLLLIEESKREAAAIEDAYGVDIKAIATAEAGVLRSHVVVVGKEADLWNTAYMPLIRKACTDESLTMKAWNSLVLVHLVQVTEKRLEKTGSKLPSTVGIYHGLLRDFPAMFRSDMYLTYQIQQAEKKAALVASGDLIKAAAIEDAEEVDLDKCSKADLQRIIRNSVATARDKNEVELGEAVRNVGKALRNFVKESGQSAATLKAVKRIAAEIDKATAQAAGTKAKREEPETVQPEAATPLTEAATAQQPEAVQHEETEREAVAA